jgi:hypothetical protein
MWEDVSRRAQNEIVYSVLTEYAGEGRVGIVYSTDWIEGVVALI